MKFRTTHYIHGAFMMSIVFYLLFGNFKVHFMRERLVPPETINLLRLVLSFVFCGILLSASFITRAIREKSIMGEPEATFLRAHIVRLACYESGALFGLFLNMAGGIFQDQLLFSVPALVLMVLAFPRESQMS